GKLQKTSGNDDATRVATDALSPSVAAAVPKESRHWFYGADVERLTEHVAGYGPPPASITAVFPQHGRLRGLAGRFPRSQGCMVSNRQGSVIFSHHATTRMNSAWAVNLVDPRPYSASFHPDARLPNHGAPSLPFAGEKGGEVLR